MKHLLLCICLLFALPLQQAQYLPKVEADCDLWAERDGECANNPKYMWKECLGSCKDHAHDTRPENCQLWASQGECSANPRYVHVHCPDSCARALLWSPWARRAAGIADASIAQLQQDAAKVETCNGIGVDAFTAATVMLGRLQRYMEGQYQHVRGLSSTSPTDFLGLYGLTEGVLYTIRLLEVVLQKGVPDDEERRTVMQQVLELVDDVRGLLRQGYSGDPLMRALPQWVQSLNRFHTMADNVVKYLARVNGLEAIDLCRPKVTPSLEVVQQYFYAGTPLNQESKGPAPTVEERQTGFTIGTMATLSNGVKMPIMGFGCWQLLGKTVLDAVLHAIRVGYRSFDAAEAYRNEGEIGIAISQAIQYGMVRREDLFIASKISDPSNAGYLGVQQLVSKQLRDLKINYLDLYMLHSPIADKKLQMETWRAMEDMVRSGLIRAIGVSNFNAQELKALYESATIKPMVVQNKADPYHVGKQLDNAGDRVIEYARQHNILVVSYSTISSYPFTLNPVEDPIVQFIAAKHSFGRKKRQEGASTVDLIGADGSIGDAIAEGSTSALVTPAQVLLRWAMQKGFAVIPRSANPARIEENYAALQMDPLSTEDMDLLDTLQILVSSPVSEPVLV